MSTEQCVLKPKVACFWVIKSRVLPRKRLMRQLTNHKAVVCFAGRNHGRSGIAMPAAFSLFVFSFLWIEMSLLGQACVYLHKIYCSWFKKKPSTICQARYITECPFKDHIRWNEISTLFKRYTKVKLVCERFLRFMASACVWFNLEIAPDTWGLARAGRQPKLFQMLPAAED